MGGLIAPPCPPHPINTHVCAGDWGEGHRSSVEFSSGNGLWSIWVCTFMEDKGLRACSVISDSLWPHELYSPPGSSVHGILQARILEWVASTALGCHFLLQGIFPTQRSNQHLLHWRQILYRFSHWESAGEQGGVSIISQAVARTVS